MIEDAIGCGPDAFVTADIKYHAFHSTKDKILLIDAGHYETEIPVMDQLKRRLSKLVKEKSNIKVLKFNGNTNPIKIYNKMRTVEHARQHDVIGKLRSAGCFERGIELGLPFSYYAVLFVFSGHCADSSACNMFG